MRICKGLNYYDPLNCYFEIHFVSTWFQMYYPFNFVVEVWLCCFHLYILEKYHDNRLDKASQIDCSYITTNQSLMKTMHPSLISSTSFASLYVYYSSLKNPIRHTYSCTFLMVCKVLKDILSLLYKEESPSFSLLCLAQHMFLKFQDKTPMHDH